MIGKTLFAAAAVLSLAGAAPAFAQQQDYANRITLFAQPGGRGDALSFSAAQSNLANSGFAGKAASVQIDGAPWQACDGVNFTGHCETLTNDVDDLASLGLGRGLASIRPAPDGDLAGGPGDNDQAPPPGYDDQNGARGGYDQGGAYPPAGPGPYQSGPAPYANPGGGRPDAVGHGSAYFADPEIRGRPVIVRSYRGDPRAAEAATDDFCRRAGYREGAYYALARGPGGAALQDVLCVR